MVVDKDLGREGEPELTNTHIYPKSHLSYEIKKLLNEQREQRGREE